MTSISCPSGIFPSDLLVQILVKLPIRSLFRFKCVCQFMYRLPSEKFFIRLYNENSSKNPMLLVEIIEAVQTQSTLVCVDRFGEFEEFSLDFLKDRVKVRASCNGFLCCASVSNRGVYYVCNPLTKGFRLLPRPRVREVTRYHPDYEATLVGLAFDPCSGKLNVALAGFYRPFGHRPLNQLVCFLFDSETNSWKRFVSSLYDEFTHMNRNQVVFSSGSLHWLTHSCSYILVLDLVNELWTKISLPDEVVASAIRTRIYLLELEGSVSLIQISGVWMCIWVLMDYVKEKWIMLDQVHLRCILGFAPSVFPISQTRDVVFLAAQKKIFMYRRKDKVWKEIYAMKDTSVYPLWFSAHPYRATLFSCL